MKRNSLINLNKFAIWVFKSNDSIFIYFLYILVYTGMAILTKNNLYSYSIPIVGFWYLVLVTIGLFEQLKEDNKEFNDKMKKIDDDYRKKLEEIEKEFSRNMDQINSRYDSNSKN
jgi:hypothetical protein